MTPYARAYARGEPGWWAMAKWVWSAGWGRLKHLALMRSSAASARFQRMSLVFLAGAFALFETTREGWRWVTVSPVIEPTGSVEPAGKGWLHIAAAPRPLPPGHPPEAYVDLWWNIAHTVIAAAVLMSVGWVVLWLLLLAIRVGVTWAHKPPYRYERRMTAAIHYATAWCMPVFFAAMIVALRPISFVGKIAGWKWCPPQRLFELPAAVLVGIGVAMWWFWLIRLGATARGGTRGRVVAFFALGVPALVGLTGAGWWYIVEPVYPQLFEKLGVNF